MNKRAIIWGHAPHTHTHSYIHYGFAKALSFLDYDVVWYEDSLDYQKEDVSNSIIISETNSCKYLPVVNSSKYFIHNNSDDFDLNQRIKGDNIYNFLVYHEHYNWPDNVEKIDNYSWFHRETKTPVIMWATDLLPDEIDNQEVVLFDDSKSDVNYIGSLSADYTRRIIPIVSSHGKTFVNYGGYSGIRSNKNNGFMDHDDNINLTKNSYLNLDIRPEQHINNGYIPCRIFKAMSYGCWIGTNSVKMNNFLAERITTNENLNDLYLQTEFDSKKASKRVLEDNKNYVKENHTYINRINSLVSIL